MNALTILAALLVVGCAALEQQAPSLDTAATAAQQVGACIKFTCDTALWSAAPVQNCKFRPGRCSR